jgi:UDP-N-acetylglucosamine 2-epimerase (non-hydrolysing)
MVLAEGDTTTTWVAAQTCFYHRIPFGHIEAGLRSHDFYQPFPEEMNRVFTAFLATWHFAPTETEKNNLLKEGIAAKNIVVTGNTVIDALYMLAKKDLPMPITIPADKKLILITAHRRESFGEPMRHIFAAALQVIQQRPDVLFVYPVHPNPQVNALAKQMLSDQKNIILLPALPYDQFVALMKAAYLIWTDSGGVQEEAPALGKPVLIIREKTERVEVVKAGVAKIVGTDTDKIVHKTLHLLNDANAYQAMVKGVSPYGDGHASERIVQALLAGRA